MNLSNFPDAIAATRLELLKAEQTVKRFADALERQTAKIDQAIAFDPDLKNDSQRKAKRSELMQSDAYEQAEQVYLAAKGKHSELEIEYQLLLNQFSVAKLQLREAIARMELQAIAA